MYKQTIEKWIRSRKREGSILLLYFVPTRLMTLTLPTSIEFSTIQLLLDIVVFVIVTFYLTFSDYSLHFKTVEEDEDKPAVPTVMENLLEILILMLSQLGFVFVTINAYFSIIRDLYDSSVIPDLSINLISVSLIPYAYSLLFLFRSIVWIGMEIIAKILEELDPNLERIRRILYLLGFVFFLIIIFSTTYMSKGIHIPFNYNSIPSGILIIIGFSLGVIINLITFIFGYYIEQNINRFEFGLGGGTSIRSILKIERIAELLKRRWILLMILLVYLPTRTLMEWFVFNNSERDVGEIIISGLYSALGEILLIVTIFLIFWLVLRTEDIILAASNLEITEKLKIVTNNKKLDEEVAQHIAEVQKDLKVENEVIWRIETARKFQSMLDGLDGLLIGAFPIILLGIFLYSIANIFINLSQFLDGKLQVIDSVLFISSLFAILTMLLYQGGRQLLIRKMKRLLKDKSYEVRCQDFLKSFHLYLESPDFVTSTLILLIPIVSFLLRFLPDIISSN